jgi:hypothetical protein
VASWSPAGGPAACAHIGCFQGAELAKAQTLEHGLTAGQDADSGGDFLARRALATQALMRSITSGDQLTQQFGPRAAIVQGQAFLLEAITPFAVRLVRGQTHAASLATSGRLPTDNHFGQPPLDSLVNRLSIEKQRQGSG